ncbi:amidase [Klugiella xanthotipulae]|uniref:Amidase n=1 Tax=Klugiella xanthotipulae TaxID=244735 RepID=A0A543HY87_9MICO|nr:amidase [Klugiella xanthotipulae]TQM63273.1 amidase [Klugiella xanthotipulae]
MTLHGELSASGLRNELAAGNVTPREAAEHYLAVIDRLNPELGAFVTVTAEAALARADALLRAGIPRDAGTRPPLWGMPLADKDLCARAGIPTGLGSRLGGQIPAVSDPLVRDLEAAGCVSLGKTNTPEYGLYGYTESAVAPPARHPEAPHLGSGGSSGGAATAVASGMLPWAPGSDGGGSVRIPAAATGLVGIKPTRGLVPADAAAPPTHTGVVSGPLAHTVAGAALLLDGMRGDTRERYGAALRSAPGRLRIAATRSSAWDDAYEITLDPAAVAAYEDALAALTALGHDIIQEEFTYPRLDYAHIFTTAWQRSAASLPVSTPNEEARLEPVTRELMHRGRALSAAENARNDADLATYGRSLREAAAPYDLVLTPALGQSPRPVGSHSADPDTNFAQQVRYSPFTSAINVAGMPAITLPVGRYRVEFTERALPMSVQLVGGFGRDALLLTAAAQLSEAVAWTPSAV